MTARTRSYASCSSGVVLHIMAEPNDGATAVPMTGPCRVGGRIPRCVFRVGDTSGERSPKDTPTIAPQSTARPRSHEASGNERRGPPRGLGRWVGDPKRKPMRLAGPSLVFDGRATLWARPDPSFPPVSVKRQTQAFAYEPAREERISQANMCRTPRAQPLAMALSGGEKTIAQPALDDATRSLVFFRTSAVQRLGDSQ